MCLSRTDTAGWITSYSASTHVRFTMESVFLNTDCDPAHLKSWLCSVSEVGGQIVVHLSLSIRKYHPIFYDAVWTVYYAWLYTNMKTYHICNILMCILIGVFYETDYFCILPVAAKHHCVLCPGGLKWCPVPARWHGRSSVHVASWTGRENGWYTHCKRPQSGMSG
jgi:hypothetical protein